MPDQTSTQVILVHLEYLREKMDEVISHQKHQNGRQNKTDERLAVLEDRAQDYKGLVARRATWISVVIGTSMAALYQYLSKLWS